MKKAAVPVSLYFDAILGLVETGLTIRQACESDPKFPMYASVYDFTNRTPDRKARLQKSYRIRDILLASQGKKAPLRHYRAFFCDRLAGADSGRANAALPKCPSA